MRPLIPLFLAISLPLLSQSRKIEESPSFVNEGVIDAPIQKVWDVFTTNEGFKALGVAKAEVDFRVGGLMRSHYSDAGVIGDENTIQNRILAYEPMRMVAFRIDTPPKQFPFKEAWKRTWSVVTLLDLGGGKTHIRIASMGYGSDEESLAMRKFFEQGNGHVVKTLQARLGPKPSAQ